MRRKWCRESLIRRPLGLLLVFAPSSSLSPFFLKSWFTKLERSDSFFLLLRSDSCSFDLCLNWTLFLIQVLWDRHKKALLDALEKIKSGEFLKSFYFILLLLYPFQLCLDCLDSWFLQSWWCLDSYLCFLHSDQATFWRFVSLLMLLIPCSHALLLLLPIRRRKTIKEKVIGSSCGLSTGSSQKHLPQSAKRWELLFLLL